MGREIGVQTRTRARARARECEPFLKWAGGKRWLVSTFPDLFPDEYHTYFEPFLGSASAFFFLQPDKAVLSDSNRELIEAYNAICADPFGIQSQLVEHQHSHSAEHYYDVRARSRLDEVARAADFIYLNRTCWNGLYRVNRQGHFNVPIGTKQRVLLPTDDFKAVARVLRRAELHSSDFERIMDAAKEGDSSSSIHHTPCGTTTTDF